MQTDSALERAEQHVKAVRDFLYHLMTFAFVSVLLIIVDVRAGAGAQPVLGLDWAYWVVLFWGLGVVGHAISVFYGRRKVDETYDEQHSHHMTIR